LAVIVASAIVVDYRCVGNEPILMLARDPEEEETSVVGRK
jgi:hypothetical protein